MNHVEMKIFPRKENDWNLFPKVVKVKSDLKISFQMLKCGKYIYLVKIFWKINNLENYLESGDVEHAYW